MAPKRRIESNGPRGSPTASHWLQTTSASGTTATARKPAQTRIADGFTLAANDRSQCHHGTARKLCQETVALCAREGLRLRSHQDRTSLRARGWEPRHLEAILSIKLCAQAMGSRGVSPSHGGKP